MQSAAAAGRAHAATWRRDRRRRGPLLLHPCTQDEDHVAGRGAGRREQPQLARRSCHPRRRSDNSWHTSAAAVGQRSPALRTTFAGGHVQCVAGCKGLKNYRRQGRGHTKGNERKVVVRSHCSTPIEKARLVGWLAGWLVKTGRKKGRKSAGWLVKKGRKEGRKEDQGAGCIMPLGHRSRPSCRCTLPGTPSSSGVPAPPGLRILDRLLESTAALARALAALLLQLRRRLAGRLHVGGGDGGGLGRRAVGGEQPAGVC